MLIGGAAGALLGLLAGLIYQPPFVGMTVTSPDVQGLTYAVWWIAGVMGGVVGLLLGVLDFGKLRR